MDSKSPFIIIGTGRSGSQLLGRMLDAHSDIAMGPEASFLIPRLWLELVENASTGSTDFEEKNKDPGGYLRTEEIRKQMRKLGGKRLPLHDLPISAADIEAISDGARRAIQALLPSFFKIDPTAQAWGLRELWNGTARYSYDWRPYDEVLPGARWIFLVRDPFDFTRSNAGHSGVDLSREYLRQRLNDWSAVLRHSRKRRQTGRYLEVRHEDIVREPETTIGTLCEFLGLPYDDACARLVTEKINSSPQPTVEADEVLTADEARELAGKVPDLLRHLDELGYSVPESFPLQKKSSLPTTAFASVTPGQFWAERILTLPIEEIPVAGLDQTHRSQFWKEEQTQTLSERLRDSARELLNQTEENLRLTDQLEHLRQEERQEKERQEEQRLEKLARVQVQIVAPPKPWWIRALRQPRKTILGIPEPVKTIVTKAPRPPKQTNIPVPIPAARRDFQVDFVIAGAQKSGTTALNTFLLHHPEICMAPKAEPHFFNKEFNDAWNTREIIDSYQRHFPNFNGQAIVGEKTPAYMVEPATIQRIHRYHPGMKFIILLRNPVLRLLSNYRMVFQNGATSVPLREWLQTTETLEPNSLPGEAIAVRRGHYSRQIAEIYKLFPREQVLIRRTSHLLHHHRAALEEIYQFLGVCDPSIIHPPEIVKSRGDKPTAEPEMMEWLLEIYREEFLRLERLLSWNLDDWRQLEM